MSIIVYVKLAILVQTVKKTSTNATQIPVKMVQHAPKALVNTPVNVFQDIMEQTVKKTSTNVTQIPAKMEQHALKALVNTPVNVFQDIMVQNARTM